MFKVGDLVRCTTNNVFGRLSEIRINNGLALYYILLSDNTIHITTTVEK